MQEMHFNELAGRVEGIGRVLLVLIEEAILDGLIDRGVFLEKLKTVANSLDVTADDHLGVAKSTMYKVVEAAK